MFVGLYWNATSQQVVSSGDIALLHVDGLETIIHEPTIHALTVSEEDVTVVADNPTINIVLIEDEEEIQVG